jgi:hypothetical protein
VFAIGPEQSQLVLANHVLDCHQENFFNAWYKPGTSQAYCIDPVPTGYAVRQNSSGEQAGGEWLLESVELCITNRLFQIRQLPPSAFILSEYQRCLTKK